MLADAAVMGLAQLLEHDPVNPGWVRSGAAVSLVNVVQAPSSLELYQPCPPGQRPWGTSKDAPGEKR